MSVAETTERTVAAPRVVPVANAKHGCPNCGSARLRSAPAPMMSPMVLWFSGKKRYGCSDCDWRGWKDPLPRRGHAKPRRILHRKVSPMTSALVIGASLVSIVLVSLQPGCASRQDKPSNGPIGVTRNPFG